MFSQIPFLYCLNTIETVNVLYSGYIFFSTLFQYGEIGNNPGPRTEKINYLLCCHWNDNSLLTQEMSKISQTKA